MKRVQGVGRVAGDYGSVGALVGLVVSVILFVVLMGQSVLIDRSEKANARMGCACLLRLVALLILTLGMGVGYMIGRSIVRGG